MAFDIVSEMGKNLNSEQSIRNFAYKLSHLKMALKIHVNNSMKLKNE